MVCILNRQATIAQQRVSKIGLPMVDQLRITRETLYAISAVQKRKSNYERKLDI